MVGAARGQAKELGGSTVPSHVITRAGAKMAFLPWLNPAEAADQARKNAVPMNQDDAKEEDLDPGENHVWVAIEAVSNEIKAKRLHW